MVKKREINQENFEKMLDWLDLDRELAGIKYEAIRSRLRKFFTLRGYHTADELADITIDIIVEKIDSVVDVYIGDPALYFYSVGKYVLLTYKVPTLVELHPQIVAQNKGEDDFTKQNHECLENCLRKLREADRKLVIAYYQESKGAKIKSRKSLADRQGIPTDQLRVNVHRIKSILKKCVRRCVKN